MPGHAGDAASAMWGNGAATPRMPPSMPAWSQTLRWCGGSRCPTGRTPRMTSPSGSAGRAVRARRAQRAMLLAGPGAMASSLLLHAQHAEPLPAKQRAGREERAGTYSGVSTAGRRCTAALHACTQTLPGMQKCMPCAWCSLRSGTSALTNLWTSHPSCNKAS